MTLENQTREPMNRHSRGSILGCPGSSAWNFECNPGKVRVSASSLEFSLPFLKHLKFPRRTLRRTLRNTVKCGEFIRQGAFDGRMPST